MKRTEKVLSKLRRRMRRIMRMTRRFNERTIDERSDKTYTMLAGSF